MAAKSKRKGAAWEREICIALSNWVSGGERGDLFWRSSMSGGRATIQHQRRKAVAGRVFLNEDHAGAGDVSAVHPDGHPLTHRFVIECRFYKELHLEQLIYSERGRLLRWWMDLIKVAEQHGRHPMLIAKENYRRPIVCLDRMGALVMRAGVKHNKRFQPRVICPTFGLHIYILDHLIRQVRPRYALSYTPTS